ncbi:uncharacterized protein LOC127844397 isoform X2 [Dreissena polymorpha]|uniref:uncharacterized protein LOC127844397 isoform X2 n=1 Tax=Dreissena polymorpha TaxID=45954 RepID=UPI0022643652|nr:uncharacterized protein LOC127844397 isoform X2 [Dreissena polymorpha]
MHSKQKLYVLLMMASSKPVGQCCKHDPNWRSKVNWLLNSLRDTLIPAKYIARFYHLLCTCEEHVAREMGNPWESITDEHLADAVNFLDNHISQNPRNPASQVIRKMLEDLRKAGEINEQKANRDCPHPVRQSSALRLLFLLRRCIEQDYGMFESTRQSVQQQQPRVPVRVERTQTFELRGITEEMIGHIIGNNGSKLLPLQRRHACKIVIESKKDGERRIVNAVITKKVKNVDSLKEIYDDLQALADDEKSSLERYQGNVDMEQDDSVNSDDSGNLSSPAEIANLSLGATGTDEPPANQLGASQGTAANQRGASLSAAANQQGASFGNPASQEGASNAEDNRNAGPNANGKRPAADAPIAAMGGAASAEERPSVCLVHDRRWAATFQFMLSRCYTIINLARKECRPFWRFICVCDEPRPDVRLYFPGTINHNMERFKHALGEWPHECQTIIQPVIGQCDRGENAETWFSLVKFAFAYDAILTKHPEMLHQDYKLPGVDFVKRLNEAASQPGPSGREGGAEGGVAAGWGVPGVAGASGIERFTHTTAATTAAALPDRPDMVDNRLVTLKRVTPADWDEDCYFHGKKKKFKFQCVTNLLHKDGQLPTGLNIPFSLAVCVCNETFDRKDYYKTERDLDSDCLTMRIHLKCVRGAGKATFEPLIKVLEDYQKDKQITCGLVKLVYHFNQVLRKKLDEYTILKRLHKQPK